MAASGRDYGSVPQWVVEQVESTLREEKGELYLNAKIQSEKLGLNAMRYVVERPLSADCTATVTKLVLEHCELTALPTEIGRLAALQTLVCVNNELTSAPVEIGMLTALQTLNLDCNKLTSLPAEIGKLKALQTLRCMKNKLSSLPAEIVQMTSLQMLDCRKNQLTFLPIRIGNLVALQKLGCSSNQLTSLPAEIGKLTALQTLRCGVNQLTSLPAEVGKLTALQELSCNSNKLTSLFKEIGNLTALRSLKCGRNRLTALPAEIRDLTALQLLDCESNKATCLGLPPEFFMLPLQCKLNFERSPNVGSWVVVKQTQRAVGGKKYFTFPIAQISVGSTVESILRYVQECAGAPCARAKNIRLMFVGNENAGKTTLVESLCGRTLAESVQRLVRGAAGKRKVTFGLDVKEWCASESMRFSVWDFAGQPEYHPTHQLFLASDALYVLAFDASAAAASYSAEASGIRAATQSAARAQLSSVDLIIAYLNTWIAMIGARAPEARVIIVGTHADKLASVAGRTALKLLNERIEDFVARLQSGDDCALSRVVIIQPCMFVDALNQTCSELAAMCVSAGSDIIKERELIPGQLLDFGKELQKTGAQTPVLTLDQFNAYALKKTSVCGERLVLTFREWGWIEYFADHPTLKNIVFVNPQWLAKMMACVATKLSSSSRRRGMVGVAELHGVWNDSAQVSNPELYRHLVSVMLAFDLAHRVDSDTLVIPSLLQAGDDADVVVARKRHKAELVLNQADDSILRPIYTLSIFPSGIFSRLFVRMSIVPEIDVLGWQGGLLAMLPTTLRIPGHEAEEPQTRQSFLRVEAFSANHSLEVAGSSPFVIAVFEEALLSLCEEFFDDRITVYRNGGVIRFDDTARREVLDMEQSPVAPAADACLTTYWHRGRRAVAVTPPLVTFDSSRDIELGMQLGKGAFGEVFRCEGTGKNAALPLGATFALKRFVRVLGTADWANAVSKEQSFDAEFGIMRELAACRFTVGALGAQFGGLTGTVVTHVLMPVFETTLQDHVRKRADRAQLEQLGWFDTDSDIVEWLMQMSQGLLFMHDRGFAHLDIKPENVFARLGGSGSVIKLVALADFGHTMHAGSVSAPTAALTVVRGSPGFIAPELFAATIENPCRDLFATDIFSLGVLASFVVSALLPSGDRKEQCGIPLHGSSVCPPVREKSSFEWDALRGLISACVAVDPARRPSVSRLVASRLNCGGLVEVDAQACQQRRTLLLPRSDTTSMQIFREQADVAKMRAEFEEQLAAERHRADSAEKRLSDAQKYRVGAEKLFMNFAEVRNGAISPASCECTLYRDVDLPLVYFLRAFKLDHLLDQCPLLRTCRLDLLLRRTESDMKRILDGEAFNTPDGQQLVALVQGIRNVRNK